MADNPARFVVNGKEYPVPTEFTLGEMCDAEQFFGVDFGAESVKTGARLVAATLYIAIHRIDPSVTVDDIRALPPEAFQTTGDDDADPPSLQPPDEKPSGSSETSGESSPNGGADLDSVPIATGQPK